MSISRSAAALESVHQLTSSSQHQNPTGVRAAGPTPCDPELSRFTRNWFPLSSRSDWFPASSFTAAQPDRSVSRYKGSFWYSDTSVLPFRQRYVKESLLQKVLKLVLQRRQEGPAGKSGSQAHQERISVWFMSKKSENPEGFLGL